MPVVVTACTLTPVIVSDGACARRSDPDRSDACAQPWQTEIDPHRGVGLAGPGGWVVDDAFTFELPSDATTPRAARKAVAERFGDVDRCGELLLCVSEVVTNAVLHARSATVVTV